MFTTVAQEQAQRLSSIKTLKIRYPINLHSYKSERNLDYVYVLKLVSEQ